MPKGSNSLWLAVFENRKGVLVQVRDQVLFVIDYGRVQLNFPCLGLKREPSALGVRLLARWRRLLLVWLLYRPLYRGLPWSRRLSWLLLWS